MSTKNIGTVVQVTGPVLDIRFPEASLPNLLNAITLEHNGKTITAEVDFSVVDGIRSSINVFQDRRPELYRL